MAWHDPAKAEFLLTTGRSSAADEEEVSREADEPEPDEHAPHRGHTTIPLRELGTQPGPIVAPVAPVFVSYAQNFEDVMLWRALKFVDAGFYIDVGAYSPVSDSVTKAFYDSGWRGINIEPDPARLRAFVDVRARDINLAVALGERAEQRTMHFVHSAGLSSLDAAEAEQRRAEGWAVAREPVEVRTLASIWSEHVPPTQAVHFLKVDVEGFERQVLLGNDWAGNRPWIVVVEATRPNSSEPSFEQWEGILKAASYAFVYFDGLNRFYVAEEHRALAATFEVPPNVFDGFVRAAEVEPLERAKRAESSLAASRASLEAITSSRSWKATAPLRAVARLARRIGRPSS